jgi:hypothetical protein
MISRRRLIQSFGAAGAMLPGAALADDAQARLAGVIRAYDAQGIHRTATEVDTGSARWLAAQLQAAGVASRIEPFTIRRIDLGAAYLQVGGDGIAGVPLFDASFTGADGVGGALGPAGGAAEIGLISATPMASTDHPGALRAALDGPHKALAIVTEGGRPGLSLINAARFLSPAGVPTLQISSLQEARLRQHAAAGGHVRLVATAQRRQAQAWNVVGTVPGRDAALAPLVVMTPRSGWWHCAGERAGGIGAWLQVARQVSAARPLRTVHFVASSGHELGQIGLDAYLATRPTLDRGAALWVHFGANIGAGPHIRLQSGDLAAQQMGVAALAAQGLSPTQIVPPGVAPGGEAGTIFRRNGRYLSLQGDNPLFHNPADRWPGVLDVPLATRQGLAFAALVTNLATSRSA